MRTITETPAISQVSVHPAPSEGVEKGRFALCEAEGARHG